MRANPGPRPGPWRLWGSIAAAIVGLAGCEPAGLPDPVIDYVVQSFAYDGEDASIRVYGEHFLPQIEVSARSGRADLDTRFSGYLTHEAGTRHDLDISLEAVDTLNIRVPQGAKLGDHSLTIAGPTGRQVTWSGVFEVTDQRPDRLVVGRLPRAYRLSDDLPVFLQLRGPAQQTVLVDAQILIRGTDSAGYPISFPDLPPWQNDCSGPAEPGDAGGYLVTLDRGDAEVLFETARVGSVEIKAELCEPTDVPPASTDIVVEPGDALQVAITFPKGAMEYQPQVGSAFALWAELQDRENQPVDDVLVVTFEYACYARGYREVFYRTDVLLDGLTPVNIPEQATRRSCANADPFSDGPSMQLEPVAPEIGHPSMDFRITPRAVTRYDLSVNPDLRAGVRFDIVVTPRDEFGNVPTSGNPVLFSASTVASDGTDGLRDVFCGSRQPLNPFRCSAVATVADDDVLLTVSDSEGLLGAISGLRVHPGLQVADVEVLVGGKVAAGDLVVIEVRPLDAWGNAMDVAVGPMIISLSDDANEIQCADAGVTPQGAALFECTLYTSRAAATVEATVAGVVGRSSSFEVINGPLAEVTLAAAGTVVAGADLSVSVAGFDPWGNAYVEQSDPVVDLRDETGTWSRDAVTLGADGTASIVGSLTLAGSTFLTASQGGVDLGVSGAILVQPGASTSYEVALLGPWAYVGTPEDVRVSAVDPFGNRTTWRGTVTLSSRSTSSPDVSVILVNGVGVRPYTWTATPSLTDVLDVTGGPWAGSSPDLVVVEMCSASDAPEVSASFGGRSEAIACVGSVSGTSTVTTDLSGSTMGSAPLAGYAVSLAGNMAIASTSSAIGVTVTQGRHDLYALVVDEAGCASELTTTVWAGPDDGSAVGPIQLSTTATDLMDVDSVSIQVDDVVDCTGATASLAPIRLRTTAGSLTGPASSGAGLEISLGAAGSTSFDLDTDGELSNGTVSVHAWVPSGAAGGRLDLPLVGDSILPTVVLQSPTGANSALVSEVSLWFSEPLDPTAPSVGSFSLSGPASVDVQAVFVESGGEQVRVVFDASADGSLGAWTLTGVSGDLHDDAGNGLSGDWSGVEGDYLGFFGSVGGTVDDVSCVSVVPTGGVFRPDGDPGQGAEADVVVVSVQSASAPAWWVLEVLDRHDGRVAQRRLVPAGTDDDVAWDGRGANGMVVPNGVYTLWIRPDDGLGNTADGCEVPVQIDNAGGG